MRVCPMCCEEIDDKLFDMHIDTCFSSQIRQDNSIQTKSEPNHNNNSYKACAVSDPSLKTLDLQIQKLRKVLKGVRDIVVSSDNDFHSRATSLYDQIQTDIEKFVKNFGNFRNHIKTQNNAQNTIKTSTPVQSQNFNPKIRKTSPHLPTPSKYKFFSPSKAQNPFPPKDYLSSSIPKTTEKTENKQFFLKNLEKDPFSLKKTENDPFCSENFRKDPFSPKKTENDPFCPKKTENSPFCPKRAENDPFCSENLRKDPFSPKKTENDPFSPKKTENDPFCSENLRKDPFYPKKTENDPFSPKKIENSLFCPKKTEKDGEKITNTETLAVTDADTKDSEKYNKCDICDRFMITEGLVLNPNCDHKTCQFCAYSLFTKNLQNKLYESEDLRCFVPQCQKELPLNPLTDFLPNEKLNNFSDQRMKHLTGSDSSFITCPHCSNTFYKDDAAGTENGLGAASSFCGVELSAEAMDHLAAHRFRCSQCREDFCAGCRAAPYHMGRTCAQQAAYLSTQKCRFCKAAVAGAGAEAAQAEGVVCGGEECRERAGKTCQTKLECGHLCGGVRGHLNCIGCIVKDCPQKARGPTGDEFCQICWVESIDAAPSVRLRCSHVFHFHCVEQRLSKKWPSARISFNYLNCPLCKASLSSEAVPELGTSLDAEFKFLEKVKNMAFERISLEGLNNDKALTDPGSKYHNNPHQFAMDKFAFYICSKCKKPYFGGARNCEEAQIENSEKFNKSDLVCGPCSAGPNAKKCKVHGNKFITFKCKFCCSVANWFCWGKTHFCDNCHRTQLGGQYLTKKQKSELPLCKGKESCPLKVDHPPNGIDFSLGCVVCLRK